MDGEPVNKRLPPGQQLVAAGKWPVIGEREPAFWSGAWELHVSGLVESPRVWTLDDLRELEREFTVDIHCVTRWSILDARFVGALLADLLEAARPLPEARFISFRSRSQHDHRSSLVLADALELGTFLATGTDLGPLAAEHGGPLRSVVPGRYFYKSVKWLKEICLMDQDELGTWEQDSGYHNHADPWREQRYIAPSIDKRTASGLIASRDLSGRDLRSIDCTGRDLEGLRAVRAILRDANFRGCRLRRADFSGANLSNAHFERADLGAACFVGADVEGACFSGSDLRGADFSKALLTACSFRPAAGDATRLDSTTRLPREALDALTPPEARFLEEACVTFC